MDSSGSRWCARRAANAPEDLLGRGLPSGAARWTMRSVQTVNEIPTRQTHAVLFDDECPLCTFQMKVLSWLDWFNALSLVPLSDPRAKILAPALGREDLLEAIHCVTPTGRIYRGARCLRFVGMRLPLLFPMALILWIPGIIYLAERVYQWISRNRLVLSRLFGCKGACAILPVREREQDKPA